MFGMADFAHGKGIYIASPDVLDLSVEFIAPHLVPFLFVLSVRMRRILEVLIKECDCMSERHVVVLEPGGKRPKNTRLGKGVASHPVHHGAIVATGPLLGWLLLCRGPGTIRPRVDQGERVLLPELARILASESAIVRTMPMNSARW